MKEKFENDFYQYKAKVSAELIKDNNAIMEKVNKDKQ